MKRNSLLVVLIFIFAWKHLGLSAEGDSLSRAGIPEIRLVTAHDSILPGQEFTVGLYVRHSAGFHSYWKGPGVVGVATSIKWTLPEGFEAGDIEWPGPERTTMAALTAYGYKREVCLLTKIKVPEEINGDAVSIQAAVGWMACAKSCHPGFGELSIRLPVGESGEKRKIDSKWSKIIEKNRAALPLVAPKDWLFRMQQVNEDQIELSIVNSGDRIETPEKLYFFCDDQQVHSDEPQKIQEESKTIQQGSNNQQVITFQFQRPRFAPQDPKTFSGVLFHPDGWPSKESKWIQISASW